MQCIVYWGPKVQVRGAPNHLAPELFGCTTEKELAPVLQMKSTKFTKHSFLATKIPQFLSTNSVKI